jgi:hypothetical protein
MAEPLLLQNWTTIQLAGAGSIVQTDTGWLDLERFTDIAGYVTTKEASGVRPELHLETAPARDDDLFQPMVTISLVPTSQVTAIVRYESASVPLARWVRWRVSASAAAVVTFRVWLCANAQRAWAVCPESTSRVNSSEAGRGWRLA